MKCESFFNFFETVDASTCEDEHEDKEEDNEEHEHQHGEKIDEDYEMGNCFKDDLIPLALEYYLGVIDQESDEEDDYGEEADEDEKPKDKKPKKSKEGEE